MSDREGLPGDILHRRAAVLTADVRLPQWVTLRNARAHLDGAGALVLRRIILVRRHHSRASRDPGGRTLTLTWLANGPATLSHHGAVLHNISFFPFSLKANFCPILTNIFLLETNLVYSGGPFHSIGAHSEARSLRSSCVCVCVCTEANGGLLSFFFFSSFSGTCLPTPVTGSLLAFL